MTYSSGAQNDAHCCFEKDALRKQCWRTKQLHVRHRTFLQTIMPAANQDYKLRPSFEKFSSYCPSTFLSGELQRCIPLAHSFAHISSIISVLCRCYTPVRSADRHNNYADNRRISVTASMLDCQTKVESQNIADSTPGDKRQQSRCCICVVLLLVAHHVCDVTNFPQ